MKNNTILYTFLIFLTLNVSCSIDRSIRKNKTYTRLRGQNKNSGYIVGISSYYGKKFHGKLTANGETFNMYDFTAAHKTLPFGTILEVENLSNNKKVTIRINDRGPFVKNRILDLSFAAAKELDMIKTGTAKIRAKILK